MFDTSSRTPPPTKGLRRRFRVKRRRDWAAVAACALAAALTSSALAASASDWWGNDLRPNATAQTANYLEVHEHLFTDFLRLTGKWTIDKPASCTGDYTDPPSCDDADTPSITFHVFHNGHEAYSDEVLTIGDTGYAGSYAEGTFTVRLYSWQVPGFSCARRIGLGSYSWRITMTDPYQRSGYETNVRHLNAFRLYCRT